MLINNDGILIDEELQEYFEKGDFSDLKITPVYLPYSQWRIKQILLEYYGCELRPYYNWYKAMRYRSCQSYVIVSLADNSIIGSEYGYTFEQLRYFLAEKRFPLHDETPKSVRQKQAYRKKRNKNAARFLEIIESLGDDK